MRARKLNRIRIESIKLDKINTARSLALFSANCYERKTEKQKQFVQGTHVCIIKTGVARNANCRIIREKWPGRRAPFYFLQFGYVRVQTTV